MEIMVKQVDLLLLLNKKSLANDDFWICLASFMYVIGKEINNLNNKIMVKPLSYANTKLHVWAKESLQWVCITWRWFWSRWTCDPKAIDLNVLPLYVCHGAMRPSDKVDIDTEWSSPAQIASNTAISDGISEKHTVHIWNLCSLIMKIIS